MKSGETTLICSPKTPMAQSSNTFFKPHPLWQECGTRPLFSVIRHETTLSLLLLLPSLYIWSNFMLVLSSQPCIKLELLQWTLGTSLSLVLSGQPCIKLELLHWTLWQPQKWCVLNQLLVYIDTEKLETLCILVQQPCGVLRAAYFVGLEYLVYTSHFSICFTANP